MADQYAVAYEKYSDLSRAFDRIDGRRLAGRGVRPEVLTWREANAELVPGIRAE